MKPKAGQDCAVCQKGHYNKITYRYSGKINVLPPLLKYGMTLQNFANFAMEHGLNPAPTQTNTLM